MNTFVRHADFDAWLRRLRDAKGKARILARIKSAEAGNFGDCEPVGDGVSEMRVHFGPGIGSISCATRRSSTCSCAAATNPRRSATFDTPGNWRGS